MSVWVKLDDGAAEHPKVEALSDAALRLWLQGLCWCARHLTDGKMPREKVEGWAFAISRSRDCTYEDLVAELTSVPEGFDNPLWHDQGDVLQVHDWLDCNPEAEQVQRRRNEARTRMKSLRSRRRSRERSDERAQSVTQHVRQPRTRTHRDTTGASSSSTKPVLRADAMRDDAARILEVYASLAQTPAQPSPSDRYQADAWLQSGIEMQRVLAALTLGASRARSSIGSLSYFAPVVHELAGADPEYLARLVGGHDG